MTNQILLLFSVSLGKTSLILSNPTLTSLNANWTAAGGDGLTGYKITYNPKQPAESVGVIPSMVKVLHLFQIT